MFKPRLSTPAKETLIELIHLMSSDRSMAKQEQITALRKAYKMESYQIEGLSKEDVQTEIEGLKEKEQVRVLTLAILFALTDGDLTTNERQIIRLYVSLLSLEGAAKMQSSLDKHTEESYDVTALYDSQVAEVEVLDESIEIMHDFTTKSVDDIDEGLLMKMQRGPVKKVWMQVMNLWQIVQDPKSDKAIKALGIGALLYLISPIDAIPDIIPILGLTDDVGIIAYVISQITKSRKQ